MCLVSFVLVAARPAVAAETPAETRVATQELPAGGACIVVTVAVRADGIHLSSGDLFAADMAAFHAEASPIIERRSLENVYAFRAADNQVADEVWMFILNEMPAKYYVAAMVDAHAVDVWPRIQARLADRMKAVADALAARWPEAPRRLVGEVARRQLSIDLLSTLLRQAVAP